MISNVGGHGVTSVLAGSDHTVAKSAQPTFQGPAQMDGSPAASNYKAPKGGGKFPPKAAGSAPAATPYGGPSTN